MILKHFWVASILLISCSEKKGEHGTTQKNDFQMPLQKYLMSEFKQDSSFGDWSISTDTLVVNSLNVNLYKARSRILDDDEFVLIKDNGSGQIYKIVVSSWSTYGIGHVSLDQQLKILESQQSIETINYQFLGLEAFLNQSTALREMKLSMDAIDSIFMFWEPMMRKIETDEDIMRIFKPMDSVGTKNWHNKVTSILKERIRCENALMYELDEVNIYYFEINPFANCWTPESSDYYEPYEKRIKGNVYNLRAMRVFDSRLYPF